MVHQAYVYHSKQDTGIIFQWKVENETFVEMVLGNEFHILLICKNKSVVFLRSKHTLINYRIHLWYFFNLKVNCIGGLIVSVLASSVVDHGLNQRL